jgi:hypothetical protein
MDYLRSYNNNINSVLSPLDTPGVSAFIRLFLILYGAMIAPALPDSLLKWFHFVPFKIMVLFLIVYTANHDPATAILIAVAFYTSLNILSGKRMFEEFRQVHTYDN